LNKKYLILLLEKFACAGTLPPTLPCAGLTAWRALIVEGQLKPGDSVLIEGTGGMSIFALQFARMVGAKVFATTGSNEKIDQLKTMGATEVINYKEDPKWGKTLFQKTGGIDHVLDVGGNATMRQSIEAAKVYGKIYSIGILGGPKGEILFPKLFFKHLSIIGLAVGSARTSKNPHIHSSAFRHHLCDLPKMSHSRILRCAVHVAFIKLLSDDSEFPKRERSSVGPSLLVGDLGNHRGVPVFLVRRKF